MPNEHYISATCTCISKGQVTIYQMIIMSTLICTRSTRLAGFFKCYMWYIYLNESTASHVHGEETSLSRT